jgi:hypothetical protein
MKKIRIKIKDGFSLSKNFLLYDSAESCLIHESDPVEVVEFDEVVLQPNEFIEAEWRGCEFFYYEGRHKKINRVRLARAHISENASGLLATVHSGWTSSIKFQNYADDQIDVVMITQDEARVDMDSLFKDHDDTEENDKY